uniref:Uncharacterized protein n=1 Tax=Anguilla anguilla TaxID=7936 RepID=A0A0E9UNH7_ANGAN
MRSCCGRASLGLTYSKRRCHCCDKIPVYILYVAFLYNNCNTVNRQKYRN